MSCKYCENETNDFIEINDTFQYSGIEMSINRQGMLRVRVDLGPLDCHHDTFDTQDIVKIKFCPFCGRKLRQIKVNNKVKRKCIDNIEKCIHYKTCLLKQQAQQYGDEIHCTPEFCKSYIPMSKQQYD